ncbi:Uncharacterised protein [Mycobacterium tuberculosis]|nr:Uncharacterised protein [Mycobacterium tuberculosis]
MADHPQPAARGDRRVFLAQRSRRAVAGVGERRLALLDEAGVERLEVVQPEEDLAADLEDLGHRVVVAGGEPFGNVGDGPGVQGDVLAGAPVAAGGGPGQPSLAVDQRQRDAVDLELTQVMCGVSDLGMDAAGPGGEFVGGERVVEAEHSFEMVDGLEIRGEAGTADQLGRRIGRAQLGMLLLEGFQTAQQLVEFRVADDRRVPHVITELVLTHLLGQCLPLPQHLGSGLIGVWGAHSGRLAEGALPSDGLWVPRERLSDITGKPDRGAGPLPRRIGQTTRRADAESIA